MRKVKKVRSIPIIILNDCNTNSNSRRDSFQNGLGVVIFVGRCVGIIARNDVLTSATSKTFSFASTFSFLLSIYLCANAVLHARATFMFKQGASSTQKLWDFQNPGWASTVLFIYIYFLYSSKKLRNLVQSFSELNRHFPTSSLPGNFSRFCWLATGICLGFGIAENVFYDVQVLQKAAEMANTNQDLELYYKNQFGQWSGLLPYHPVLASIHIGVDKLGYLGWLLADALAIVLSKAISEKFRVLKEYIMTNLFYEDVKTTYECQMAWDKVNDQLLRLLHLTHQVEDFIVPLIWACYGINIYIIVINLLIWISPSSPVTLDQGYYVFAFFEFVFRVTTVTYFVAEIHHVSHSLLSTIQRCPNSFYSLSPKRIERMLTDKPPGICIFGSFMITRKFFVSIVRFLFTIEIVLLQTTSMKV